MKSSRVLLAAAIGTAALLALVALLGDPSPLPPAGAPWDFPVHSWVRRHDVDLQGDHRLETDEQWTLLERDDVQVSVELRRTGQGFIPAVESFHIGLRDEIDSLEGARRVGRDPLTLGGEVLDCDRWEKTGEEATTRLWTHARCRWPVKLIHQRRGTTPELVERAWLAQVETIRIADRDLRCDRFKETRQMGGKQVEETDLWLCPSVPGHIVRRTQRIFDPNGEANVRTEVTGYGTGSEAGSRNP